MPVLFTGFFLTQRAVQDNRLPEIRCCGVWHFPMLRAVDNDVLNSYFHAVFQYWNPSLQGAETRQVNLTQTEISDSIAKT